MLLVLTSEKKRENEAMLLNQLFEEGLEVLHLRKPSFSRDEYRQLLREIQPEFYQRIMIHQFHDLCAEFILKGIHLQEQPRIDLQEKLEAYVSVYMSEGFSVSSSFHDPKVLEECDINFDYHLLSPVFSSISKKGYEGKGFDVNSITKEIIGMGGVNAQTIPEVFKLGYSGIGVLGGVWNSKHPIHSFKEINQQYNTVFL